MKTYYNSPIGRLVITGSMNKIMSIAVEETSSDFAGKLPAYMQRCVDELDAYFNNGLECFSVDLKLGQGTLFQQRVWKELLAIPYGRTSTYLKIAEKVSTKKAVRAVGRCVGNNPFSIVAPCHRVIGTDGSLTGFAHGLEAKRLLLELEKSKLYGKQYKLF